MGSITESEDIQTIVGFQNANPSRTTTNFLILLVMTMTLTSEVDTAPTGIPPWAMGQGSNLWVTLAKEANTDTIYLSNNDIANPFSTCLVGIPLNESVRDFYKTFSVTDRDPVEFELLCTAVTNFCIYFERKSATVYGKPVEVTPKKDIYKNTTLWCNGTKVRRINIDMMYKPLKLNSGDFLICGERAWCGIPANPEGGPCTLGLPDHNWNNNKIYMSKNKKGGDVEDPKKRQEEYRKWRKIYKEYEEDCE
ncbi:hypothetical protein BTVI_00769 [Pitangus sulphuratus]|nr:hypothetical protein BTVI_00769 [Pitangus sulphuratus]